MTRREWFLVGFVVCVVGVALLTGCAVCRPDCRGMTHEDCLSLVASCQQVNANVVPYHYGEGKQP